MNGQAAPVPDRSVEGIQPGAVGTGETGPGEFPMTTLISWVLRVGVALSFVVITVGLILLFVHHPEYRNGHVGYRHALGTFGGSRSIGTVAHQMASGDGAGIIMAGLAILLATPVVRVAVSFVGFGLSRDVRMALVTGIVLMVLVGSIFFGSRL